MVTKPRPDARTCGEWMHRERAERHHELRRAGPHGTGRRTNKPKGRGVGGRSAPIVGREVPLTLGNRGQRDPAEERRASHEAPSNDPLMGHDGGNPEFHKHTSTKQQWIAEQAEKHPGRPAGLHRGAPMTLHHLIDEEWMLEAYRRTRKDGATGIDGVTAADYEKELEANLADLSNRIRRNWRPISRTSRTGSSQAATTRHRCDGSTSPRRTDHNALWASRPSKTRWRSGQY